MARIRTIKPEFHAHEELSSLPAETHLLAAALVNYADDEGYFNANPILVKAGTNPLRSDQTKIEDQLLQLEAIGYIEVRRSGLRHYGKVLHFDEHQRVSHLTPSKLKGKFEKLRRNSGEPPEPLRNISGGTPEDFRPELNRREQGIEGNLQTVPNGTVSTEAVKPRSVAALDPALVAGWLPIIRSRKTTPPGQQFVRVGEEYRYLVLRSQVDEWAAAFTGVNVLQELREAKQWLLAVPTRRKTDVGVVKFIVSWLAREQDKSGGSNERTGDVHTQGHSGSNGAQQRYESPDEQTRRAVDEAKRRITERYRREVGSAEHEATSEDPGT